MIKKLWLSALICAGLSASYAQKAQSPVKQVNVFLGTSGDHGQLSPGATAPFSLMDICPQTYPNIHTGYDHRAKLFLGFTHNRLEGVGCRGSGGNLLIKPFSGTDPVHCELLKSNEAGQPGFYSVNFVNGQTIHIALDGNEAVEEYAFSKGKPGLLIDLSSALANGFIDEQHQLKGNVLNGWIKSGTTCRAGAYTVYFALRFDKPVNWEHGVAHQLIARPVNPSSKLIVHVALSAVDEAHAQRSLTNRDFEGVLSAGSRAWNKVLSEVQLKGNASDMRLFCSLLYRVMQSPQRISEDDGSYRSVNGIIQQGTGNRYHGWAIWDNYKTALPLLSLLDSSRYQAVINSITGLYKAGKKDWAGKAEPANTVRTEHAVVVLLDAYRKGYYVDFATIKDSLLAEQKRLDFSHPDKALESCYDTWALSEIMGILQQDSLHKTLRKQALNWKKFWQNDFADLTKRDVDQLGARNMYQGTIWQYRWQVPFDQQGLIDACGGEAVYLKQLDEFFAKDYYNAANEPDIQVPDMYQYTSKPWRSQYMIRHFAQDSVIQYYYDENYRGIDPSIDRVFNNRPEAFVRSMDDDAGAMSAWYVLAACGLSPGCVGWPVWYLHVPIFREIRIGNFHIRVIGTGRYIRSAKFNGKTLDRNWLTQQEIREGGNLLIQASDLPNQSFGGMHRWLTDLNKN